MPVLLWATGASALEPIEALGKNVFFDESLSVPRDRQACASCHDPKVGWILPDSVINKTTVVAPGARPGASGSIKVPTNAYASFSPVFRSLPPTGVVPWEGGNFADGRAEGCGAESADPHCQLGDKRVSETITAADLGVGNERYAVYLGPTADQALNPFPNRVEQNIRERQVCQRVKTAPYKALYAQTFGEPINCRTEPQNNPGYKTSFKRIAVSLAAWQSSSEVASFSSRRDACISGKADRDGKFPCENLTDQENLGHDIFFGVNTTGRNRFRIPIIPGSGDSPAPVAAGCSVCHNGVPQGESADSQGEAPRQLFTDNRYHNIGVPYNREIPGVDKGDVAGLSDHIDIGPDFGPGEFRTTTLRNVGKGVNDKFTKAYMHNGYFKSLKQVVHFYNTSQVKERCKNYEATAAEAIENDCWPEAEFPEGVLPSFFVGDLQLSPKEEAALVAYLKTFSDKYTPQKP